MEAKMNNNLPEKYFPQPVDTSDIKLGKELEVLVEAMAKNVHEVWAATRIEQGWSYGPERNDEKNSILALLPMKSCRNQKKNMTGTPQLKR